MHLIFITTLQSGHIYYPYISDEETEVQERQRALPKVMQLLCGRAVLKSAVWPQCHEEPCLTMFLVAFMGSFAVIFFCEALLLGRMVPRITLCQKDFTVLSTNCEICLCGYHFLSIYYKLAAVLNPLSNLSYLIFATFPLYR